MKGTGLPAVKEAPGAGAALVVEDAGAPATLVEETVFTGAEGVTGGKIVAPTASLPMERALRWIITFQ